MPASSVSENSFSVHLYINSSLKQNKRAYVKWGMGHVLFKGKKVLVVDDILTTGSTISEVARQLKIAGATNVYGLVVASPKYILQMENNAIW